MAYQAKRAKVFREDFELVDENGTVVKRMEVVLGPEIATDLSKKYLSFVHAQEAFQRLDPKESPEKTLEQIGTTVKDILEVIFGQENADYIIKFYDGRYIEMSREVLPFVWQVIPEVRKIGQEYRKTVVAGYNRKTRRKLFGK